MNPYEQRGIKSACAWRHDQGQHTTAWQLMRFIVPTCFVIFAMPASSPLRVTRDNRVKLRPAESLRNSFPKRID
jgi:hypothetical protein